MAEWELPPDLCQRQQQLEVLELPETVDRLDWITAPLRELRAEGGEVESARAVPRSVQRLSLRESALTSLRGLPPALQHLDATGCSLESLEGLPRELRSLSLSNVPEDELSRLPTSIRSLGLDFQLTEPKATELADLRWAQRLPQLTTLRLEGEGVLSMEGIPSTVRRLTIKASRPRVVEFPPELHCLELVGTHLGDGRVPPHLGQLIFLPPPRTTLAEYPRFLHRLSLLGGPTPALSELPRSLNRLDLLPDTAPRTLNGVPSRLQHLQFVASELEPSAEADSIGFPPDLVHLGLVDYRAGRLPDLPSRQLRSFDLSWARIDSLEKLPTTLRELVLTGASIEEKPGGLEESNLRVLEWRSSNLSEPPPLPDSLRHLDLSDSPSLHRLGSLPTKLETLRLSNTALKSLPNRLPPTLVEIDIRGTCIRTLEGLQEGLEVLIVDRGQLESLEGLPTTVRTLRILDPLDADSRSAASCAILHDDD